MPNYLNHNNTQGTYNRNFEARSRHHCCRGEAISITYSQYVCVALFIQKARCIRRIILSSVACPAVSHSSTLYHKRQDLRKNVIEHTVRVLVLPTTFVLNISHSKSDFAKYLHKCTQVSMQSTRYSCQISIKLEFSL